MNIGVLGGTFDPIHLGHLKIAEAAYNEYQLDSVWFMPAGDPYFKRGRRMSPPSVRYEMTKLCVEDYAPYFEASDFEIRSDRETYTATTFRWLNEVHPDDSFSFILGFDSLKSIDHWYRPDLLLKNTTLLCAARPEDMTLSDGESMEQVIARLKREFHDYSPVINVIHSPLMDISSTKIRNLYSMGEDISPYVTPVVEKYIREHDLYDDFVKEGFAL